MWRQTQLKCIKTGRRELEVMEKVYDDLKFAFENLRLSDGAMYLNKDIAAGFITRIMLYEGTWQKYHNLDQALAKKYLEFAKEAGDYVIGTGKYAISGDFRSLFGSQDLKGHKEMLMYRHYDAANATHHVASYSNGYEGQSRLLIWHWLSHSYVMMVNRMKHQQCLMPRNWISNTWLKPVIPVLKLPSGMNREYRPVRFYTLVNLSTAPGQHTGMLQLYHLSTEA